MFLVKLITSFCSGETGVFRPPSVRAYGEIERETYVIFPPKFENSLLTIPPQILGFRSRLAGNQSKNGASEMSASPLPRSSKPARLSPFFRDLASPISSHHRGGRFATPGQAAAVSALWRENFSSSDPPPPPVFTLDDRADFSPEPALAELPPPSPASPTGFTSGTPPPSAPGGGGSFSRSPSLSSPSALKIRAEVNGSEGKQAAHQAPESSSWIHRGEKERGSPVDGVVERGALLMLPPPREVAKPEPQKSSSVANGGLKDGAWVTVFGYGLISFFFFKHLLDSSLISTEC